MLTKVGKQAREKIEAGKLKFISAQVEHDHIEETLNGLEETKYELAHLLDGNIWARMILKKREEATANGKKRDSKVLQTQN